MSTSTGGHLHGERPKRGKTSPDSTSGSFAPKTNSTPGPAAILGAPAGGSPDPIAFENLPLSRKKAVRHVGTLNPADRKKLSYEGEGLAVSMDADVWARIAKLPGDTWTLRRKDSESLTFVSFRDMRPEEIQKVRTWGEKNGWMEARTVYRVYWYDDELDSQVWMECDTKDEALEEQEMRDPDETIAETIAWRPTETFPDSRVTRDTDTTDVLLAHYIREHRPDLDGVWWNDDYNPNALSCPRGVLVHPLESYDISRREA